jgi:aspartate aminotransferase
MLSKFTPTNIRSVVSVGRAASFSLWSKLEAAPPDPILGLNEAFKKETNPKKVLLGMGTYKDDNNKPYVLSCVRKAEQIIFDKKMDHEYAGIQGIDSFVDKSVKLAYGEDNRFYKEGTIAGAQSISGTGSLRLAFEVLKNFYPNKDVSVLVPNQTWPIHRTICEKTGFKWENYRYYEPSTKSFTVNGMLEDLDKAKEESIVVLHVCAHNPTGCDPSQDDWKKILEVVKRKKHFCAFDSAYQGFATGDLLKDAYALRLFSKEYDRMLLCQSFAKNFGLYGERAGCLSFVTTNKNEKEVMMSRIKQTARPIYSNPPIHGARIVDIILGDQQLTEEWYRELKVMSGRMMEMRKGLHDRLKALGNPHKWNHIED